MQNGHFIISLDFELFWGVRDKLSIENYGENIRGVQNVIPRLLKAFDEYKISATFATVGFLFAKDKKEILQFKPDVIPKYSKERYSPYENHYLEKIGSSEADDIYHFGNPILQQLIRHQDHEIASHTFSHYYCLEGASIESFEADMVAAKKIAEKYGITLTSIVFPRNQYSPLHLKVCQKLGFMSFRGNENSIIYQPRQHDKQSLAIRAVRLLDSYINLTGHQCIYPETITKSSLLNIPASRFLRPYNAKLKQFEPFKINRIKKGMTYAAKKNLIFHLWWHPHNFGKDLEANMDNLTKILNHYKTLYQQFNFQSTTMNSLTKILQNDE